MMAEGNAGLKFKGVREGERLFPTSSLLTAGALRFFGLCCQQPGEVVVPDLYN